MVGVEDFWRSSGPILNAQAFHFILLSFALMFCRCWTFWTIILTTSALCVPLYPFAFGENGQENRPKESKQARQFLRFSITFQSCFHLCRVLLERLMPLLYKSTPTEAVRKGKNALYIWYKLTCYSSKVYMEYLNWLCCCCFVLFSLLSFPWVFNHPFPPSPLPFLFFSKPNNYKRQIIKINVAIAHTFFFFFF